MRKLLCAKTFIALSLFAMLAVTNTMQMPPAQAMGISTGSLVDVMVDATSPSCFFVRTDNVGTPIATKTRIPCAPYTLVKIVSISQSQAIARHEPYVLHPNVNATQAVWRTYFSQIHQIVESKRIALGASGATAQAEIPAPACSSTWSQYESWPTVNGDSLDLTISFFDREGSGCNHIYLQTSTVTGRTSPNATYLDYQAYDDFPLEPVWAPWAYIGTNTMTHHWGGNTDPRLPGYFYMYFGDQPPHENWYFEFSKLV